MATSASDREDLMREAVALPERVELRADGFAELVTIGFRSNSAMSVFLGQDPVYQFDPAGRLRRAFVGGLLFRSQHNTLARLERHRSETATQLLRTDLNSGQLNDFRSSMTTALASLADQLLHRRVSVIRCVPEAVDLLPRIESAIQMILSVEQWLSPEIRRRV